MCPKRGEPPCGAFPTLALMPAVLTVFILLGPEGASPAEQWVAGGRRAAAVDAARLAAGLPGVERVVVATSEADWAGAQPGLPVTWDLDAVGEAFHFGRRLAGLVQRYPAEAYLYLGAGSAPLLAPDALAQAVEAVLSEPGPRALTNNLYSSDWMAFNCPEAVVARAERLPADNALGWVLMTEAGVSVRALAAAAGTRLDIDTPADLLLLALHSGTGPALRAYLNEHPGDSGPWRQAGRRLFTRGAQAALLGRVASGAWAHVEANTQAWVRVYSEERGMTASGRLAAGQVRSLVGAYLLERGPEAFFEELSRLAEAAFFDTRVIMAAHSGGRMPAAADRYASDLGWAEAIADPWLRAFTQAAQAAPIPTVLGGHGVVAGDLYGLVEIAQAGGLE
jgi:CTP:molybdopterin cytidylyltransferase MocA